VVVVLLGGVAIIALLILPFCVLHWKARQKRPIPQGARRNMSGTSQLGRTMYSGGQKWAADFSAPPDKTESDSPEKNNGFYWADGTGSASHDITDPKHAASQGAGERLFPEHLLFAPPPRFVKPRY